MALNHWKSRRDNLWKLSIRIGISTMLMLIAGVVALAIVVVLLKRALQVQIDAQWFQWLLTIAFLVGISVSAWFMLASIVAGVLSLWVRAGRSRALSQRFTSAIPDAVIASLITLSVAVATAYGAIRKLLDG